MCIRDRHTGGWCYEVAPKLVGHHRSGGMVHLAHNHTFILPLHHYAADMGVVRLLLSFLDGELPFTPKGKQTMVDFGAGVGQYGHALLSLQPSAEHEYMGYDGAGNVEEWTAGFVRFFDLTLPLSLPRRDWVLSLEVGEHVPARFEDMYLRNLHAHNCKGIILSWAHPGQLGTGHINNRAAEYVWQRLEELGYAIYPELSQLLRTGSFGNITFPHHHEDARTVYGQLRTNIYAYRRYQPVC
eukprot:5783121-Prymnesium_polylepis.1